MRDPNTLLSVVVKDDRLSPNRRLFAVLMTKYFSLGMKHGKPVPMSEQESRDKDMLYNVIVTQYGNPKSIQWLDREDAGPTEPLTKENADATDKIREAFEIAMRPKSEE